MDPITLTIELLGLALFLTFLVLPAREFRQIYHRLTRKPAAPASRTHDDPTP